MALTYFKTIWNNKYSAINNLAHLGRVYAKMHLFDEAIECYEEFLDDNPQAYIEYFQVGLVCLELARQDGLRRNLDKSLQINQHFTPALYYRAIASLMEDDESTALKFLDKTLASAEENNLYFDVAKKLKKSLNDKNESTTAVKIENLPYGNEFDVE